MNFQSFRLVIFNMVRSNLFCNPESIRYSFLMTKLTLLILIAFMMSGQAWSKRSVIPYAGRLFTLVTPDKASERARPLLVLLHGCKQNPNLILDGTLLEQEANANDFLILVPEQPQYLNIDHCWNWFLSFQQMRMPGTEMSQIISGVDFVFNKFKVNRNKVYVAGISAGGVMAHNLAVCYPDYFAGAAIHSGLNFKIAENMIEAQNVLTSYEQKSPEYLGEKMVACAKSVKQHKLSKVLIIHGEQDSRVPPLHSELISEAQAVWRDYLDDGRRNDSASGIQKRKISRSLNGYEVEQTDTLYPRFSERRIMIKNLGHAWGGGKPVSVNFDPKAPSSNGFILDYFQLLK